MPLGTVFKSRLPIGNLNQGMPEGGICHRILWLDGLEPGWNRGGEVDTRRRYIYIHGYYDEATLGRPASLGCVHVAAAHLLPLYDWLPKGALVWIQL
jgi:lipoprotein-anchoring transpeptidase ErfK/SrfK